MNNILFTGTLFAFSLSIFSDIFSQDRKLFDILTVDKNKKNIDAIIANKMHSDILFTYLKYNVQ